MSRSLRSCWPNRRTPFTSPQALASSRERPLDVVIHEPLKRRGKLIVIAAQRRHVPAVDEDWTARLFARAGKADAYARGLRFPRSVDDAAHDRERHRLHAFVRRLPLGHLVAHVVLNLLGQFLER